jgi:outer membrane protein TolC
VRAARDRVAAVAYEQIAAHRAYLPDLEFNANFGLQSRTTGRLFESGSHEWSAGPVLSLPIFDGGQRAAVVRGQDAQYAAMLADYQATVIRAVDEVSRALSGRTANAESLVAAEKAKDADVLALKSVERRYAAGISSETELHAAQIHVLEREREIIRLVARAKTLDVDLIEALGGIAREEKAK